jgi:hypothetical protein
MTVCFAQIYKPDQDERFNLPVAVFWAAFVSSACGQGCSFVSCHRSRIAIILISYLFTSLFSKTYLQKSRHCVETSAEHFPSYLYYEVSKEQGAISVHNRDIDELETDELKIEIFHFLFCLATTLFVFFVIPAEKRSV